MKYHVSLEWEDTPDLIDSGYYTLRVVSVKPFKSQKGIGWTVTFAVLEVPKFTIMDWLTVKTSSKSGYWKVEKTQKFLQHAGLAGSEESPTKITHSDLMNVEVKAHVIKKVQTYRGEAKLVNVVASYHAESFEAPSGKEEIDKAFG